jgi:hypothetical protein
MTASKLPHQVARERLAKRARDHIALVNKVVPKSMQKTPSQKKSEAGRKKFLKRAGLDKEPEPPQDCYGCEKDVPGKQCNINTCPEKAMVHRCLKCGAKVRHRIVAGIPWEYCPSCRGARLHLVYLV